MSFANLGPLRAYAERWLNDSCTIEKQEMVTGEFGEVSQQWRMVAQDVACRVITAGRQVQSQIHEVGKQETLRDLFKIALPAGTEVNVDYRITTGGVVYHVVQIEAALTDEFFTQVIALRHRGSGDG